ncbi:MAG: tetratricopeptide repeat protein, partial [Nevskiales bacterium]
AAAAYGLTLAWQQAADQASDAQRLAARKNFISSGLRLAERYPAHPEQAAVLTRCAELLLELQDLPQAAGVARRVTQLAPAAPEALRYSAWSVLAAAEFQQAHYAEAESAYRELLRLGPERDPRRIDTQRALAASLYRQAEQRKQSGDLRTAAELFLRVGQTAPDSDVRPTAEYDAGAAFISLKDWPRAIRVLEDFRARYPQHPLQPDVGRKLAVAYTENGQKDKAAVEFARIGTAGGESETVRQEAAWQAAELHAQAGQNRQAMA